MKTFNKIMKFIFTVVMISGYLELILTILDGMFKKVPVDIVWAATCVVCLIVALFGEGLANYFADPIELNKHFIAMIVVVVAFASNIFKYSETAQIAHKVKEKYGTYRNLYVASANRYEILHRDNEF